MDTSSVVCECGCGQPAPIAKKTRTYLGHVKGQPIRFINGHSARTLSEQVSVEEDRGYQTSCWIWKRSKDQLGYGMVRLGKKCIRAHVRAFIVSGGTILQHEELDHLCRQRDCVNPDHLEAVLHAVNVRRGKVAKLNPVKVAEIRALLSAGASQREIAKRFGVCQYTIGAVKNRVHWGDVA